MEYDVYEVNKRRAGKKRSSRRKATSRKAPKKKSQSSKRKSSRRKSTAHRGGSFATATARVNGRRRHSRRRHNPSLGGVGSALKHALSGVGGRVVGMIAAAAAVKFAAKWNVASQEVTSEAFGARISWQQYAAGVAVAVILPKFVGRFINPSQFQMGAVDFLVGKAVFIEAVGRVPILQQYLGDADAVSYTPDGQAWLQSGNTWAAMQGLVEAGPYDRGGLHGLVDAGPLDGTDPYTQGRSSDPFAG